MTVGYGGVGVTTSPSADPHYIIGVDDRAGGVDAMMWAGLMLMGAFLYFSPAPGKVVLVLKAKPVLLGDWACASHRRMVGSGRAALSAGSYGWGARVLAMRAGIEPPPRTFR